MKFAEESAEIGREKRESETEEVEVGLIMNEGSPCRSGKTKRGGVEKKEARVEMWKCMSLAALAIP